MMQNLFDFIVDKKGFLACFVSHFHVCHSEKFCGGQHVLVDLYLASGNQKQRSDPCYSMTIVDLQHSSAKNGKFVIFIVPQGECHGIMQMLL